MKKDEIKKLIINLGNNTKDNTVKWNIVEDNIDIYDPDNEFLKDYILKNEREVYVYKSVIDNSKFLLNQSYYADILNGRVYLFKYITEKYGIFYLFAVKSEEYNYILSLNDEKEIGTDEIQIALRELNYVIEKVIENTKVNNINKYVEELIKWSNNDTKPENK